MKIHTLPNRMIFIVGGLAFAIVLGVLGIYRLSGNKPSEAGKGDGILENPLPPGIFKPTKVQWESLRIASVQAQNFRAEQITDGMIATNDNTTVNVFSPYSGRVTKVVAKLGDLVRKGDVLMAVQASEFVQGQNDLITANASLNTATTQLRLAEKTEYRQHELYLAKAGALKDWQQAQSDMASVRNNMRSAEIVLAAARNRLRILGKSDQEIAALENEPNVQRMQSEAMVAAPGNGTVVQRQVGPGQYIQSASGGASNPVFSIADLSTVWLVANLREANVGAVKIGQPVEVRVLAYPNRIFKAKITFISPTVDANTHRVPVRAEIANSDSALKPLMAASFTIFTSEASSAPSVPQNAVVYDGSTAKVFVVRPDGSVQVRTVELGRQSADSIEVVSGLAAGETIVISGTLFIDRASKGSQA